MLLAVVLGWWNFDTFRIWAFFIQPRATPLPVFDAGRAAQLGAERRAELERELFTELYMWNTQSRRYQEPGGLEARERRWREMAEEGYELAYLALTVFEPGEVRVHYPLPALWRLEELARSGDAGAMCLIPAIVTRLPSRGGIDWGEYRELGKAWMQKGADAGHPECLILLGSRLQAGSDGFAKEERLGQEMLVRALRNGYLRAAGSFWLHYRRMGLENFENRRLVYCWGYLDAKADFIDPALALSVYLRSDVDPGQRELIRRELLDFHEWHPTAEECIEMSRIIQGMK